MKRSPRRLSAERDGTAALEFALVGPIFVSIVLFTVGVGMLLWAKGAMQVAAARTARCTAISSPDCPDPQAYAASLIRAWGVSGIVPTVVVSVRSVSTCDGTTGRFSAVAITGGGPAGLISPLSSVTLNASACYPSGA